MKYLMYVLIRINMFLFNSKPDETCDILNKC